MVDNNLKTMLLDSIKVATKESTVETPADEKDIKSTSTDNNESTENDSKAETEEAVITEKKKKHSFQGRIDTLTAKNRQFEEQLAKFQAENELLKAQFSGKKEPNEPAKPDKPNFSTVEELEDYLGKVVTKDDIASIVQKIIDERLKQAKEGLETETKQQSLDRMKSEFQKEMYDYYIKFYDEDEGLDENVKAEANQIFQLFESNPGFYLEKIKKSGLDYLRKFVNGEFENEKKADKVRTVIDKAMAIRTNTDGDVNVRATDADIKGMNLRDILKNAIKRK